MSEIVVGDGNSTESRYDSIENAIASSNSGDTILINKNVHLSNDVKIDRNLTINGNGNNIDLDCAYGFQILAGNVKFNNLSFICENKCTAFTKIGNDEINLELSNINIRHRELKHDSFFPVIYSKKLDNVDASEFNLYIYNCSIDYIHAYNINKLAINGKSKIGNIGTKVSSIYSKKINIENSQVNNCNITSDDYSNSIIMNNVSTTGGLFVDGNLDLNNFSVDSLSSYKNNEEWSDIFREFNSSMPLDALITNTEKNQRININITNTNLDYKKLVEKSENLSVLSWFNFKNSNVTFINSSISKGVKYSSLILDSNISLIDSVNDTEWHIEKTESVLNDKKYKFIDAVNASQPGDIIQLKNSITLNQNIYIDHDLTIEGNGNTINISSPIGGFHPNSGNITFNNLSISLNDSNFIYKNKPGNTNINLNNVKIKNISSNPDTFNRFISNLKSLGDENIINLYINHSEIEYMFLDKINDLIISKNSVIGNAVKAKSELSANSILINDSIITNTTLKSRNNNYIKMNNVSTFGTLKVNSSVTIYGFNVLPLPNHENYNEYEENIKNFNRPNNVYALIAGSNDDKKVNIEIKNAILNHGVLVPQKNIFSIGAWFKFFDSNVNIVDSNISNSSNNSKLYNTTLEIIDSIDNSEWNRDDESTITSHKYNKNIIEPTSNMITKSMKELNQLIGLGSIKEQLIAFIGHSMLDKERANRNDNYQPESGSMNMVFEGRPGTGKTAVARLFAKILYERGVLKTDNFHEVKASDLISKAIGETATKTKEVVESSLDGLLFIDEAYALAPPHKSEETNYNHEAISELIADIENNRDRLVVIMAGYQDEMEDFLNRSNPGLISRFPNKLIFPDYSKQELLDIFDLQIKGVGNDDNHIYKKCTPEAREAVKRVIDKLYDADKIYDNARFIRDKVIEKISLTHDLRILRENGFENISNVTDADLDTFTEEDVKEAMGQLLTSLNVKNDFDESYDVNETAMDTLNSLIGLDSVKIKALNFSKSAFANKFRKEHGFKSQSLPMNMVFEGNPGTGKTEVARLLAKVLFEQGVLKTDNFHEVKASDLVAEHVGQTAPKTRKVVKSALNGVLFIDEAYALSSKDDSNTFNDEAISELIADIENYRDKIVVIMAGYTNEMEYLLKNTNPGLASRFPNKIKFPDYSSEELFEILKYTFDKRGLHCTDDALDILKQMIDEYSINASEKSNGRFIRNMVGDLCENQLSRTIDLMLEIEKTGELDENQRKQLETINSEDAKKTVKRIMNDINNE